MVALIPRLFRLGLEDWVMLVVAAVALVRGRVSYGRASVQGLVHDLGERSAARLDVAVPAGYDAAMIDRLRWALAALGPRMPFRADCMIQVLAAERILVRWGLSPKFFLGVERSGPDGFSAHVWLQVGDQVVTGGDVDNLSVMIGRDGV